MKLANIRLSLISSSLLCVLLSASGLISGCNSTQEETEAPALSDTDRNNLEKERILTELAKECESDNGDACFELGWFYHDERTAEQDYTKALFFFEKACRLDVWTGCSNAGIIYKEGLNTEQNFCLKRHAA